MDAMTRTDLAELIRNGENSFVDFRRDDITPEVLPKVIPGMREHNGTEPDSNRRGASLHRPALEGRAPRMTHRRGLRPECAAAPDDGK